MPRGKCVRAAPCGHGEAELCDVERYTELLGAVISQVGGSSGCAMYAMRLRAPDMRLLAAAAMRMPQQPNSTPCADDYRACCTTPVSSQPYCEDAPAGALPRLRCLTCAAAEPANAPQPSCGECAARSIVDPRVYLQSKPNVAAQSISHHCAATAALS